MDTDVPKWMEMIVEKIAMLEILLIPLITTLEASQLSRIVKQAIQAICAQDACVIEGQFTLDFLVDFVSGN